MIQRSPLSDFFYFARRLESFGCARKAKGAVRGICAKDLFFFVAESSFFLFLSLFLLSSVSQVPQPTWLVNCLMASPPGCSLKSPLMMVMMLQRSRKSKMRKNEEEVKMCDLKIKVGPLVANINAWSHCACVWFSLCLCLCHCVFVGQVVSSSWGEGKRRYLKIRAGPLVSEL